MTAEVYEMFKSTNPKIRAYERDRIGRIVLVATCSKEKEGIVEKIIKSNENIKIVSRTDETIYLKVISDDDITDKIINDFF